MKGRMDVLNFEKPLSSESEIKSYRDRSTTYEEFKMELDGDEREKENDDVLSECSDFVIDTVNITLSVNLITNSNFLYF